MRKPTRRAQFENAIERKLLNLKVLKRKREDAWGVFYSILCQERPITYVRKLLSEWETLDVAVKQLEAEMHLGDQEMQQKWQLRADAVSAPVPVTPQYVEDWQADRKYYAPQPQYAVGAGAARRHTLKEKKG